MRASARLQFERLEHRSLLAVNLVADTLDFPTGGAIVPFEDQFYFGSGDGLYRTDGTSAGTELFFDNAESRDDANQRSARVDQIVPAGELLYFFLAHNRPIDGRELWVTDGTTEPTRVWSGFGERGISDVSIDYDHFVFDGHFYFLIEDQVWKSDGTAEGTSFEFASSPRWWGSQYAVAGNYHLHVDAHFNLISTNLETLETIELVAGMPPSRYVTLSELNGRVILHRDTSDSPRHHEIWATDGTAEGTELIVEIDRNNRDRFSIGDLYYYQSRQEDRFVLNRTDGTKEGTRVIQDILPSVPENSSETPTNINGGVYFWAAESVLDGGESRSVLYAFNGEPDGTRVVLELDSNLNRLSQYEFTAKEDDVFLELLEGGNGTTTFGLWKANVSSNTLEQIKGFTPWSTDLMNFIHLDDGGLLFTAVDEVLGGSIWRYTPDELVGDVDRSGEINFADFLVLSENFGKEQASYEDGDLDGDNMVGFSDFLLLAAKF